MILGRYFHDIEIAIESLRGNKLKSFLTALGIIFGVAAVISMLSIGNGAQKEILEQIRLVGANNIIINAVDLNQPDEGEDDANASTEKKGESNKFSPGLSANDLKAIRNTLPSVKYSTPLVSYKGAVQAAGTRMNAEILGVNSEYFDIYHLSFETGAAFLPIHEDSVMPVCVIGSKVKVKLFGAVNPMGKELKFKGVWYRVVGVLSSVNAQASTDPSLGVTVYNDKIYIPVQTLAARYKNRSRFTPSGVEVRRRGNSITATRRESSQSVEYDRIIVQVDTPEDVSQTRDVIARILNRLHRGVQDYAVVVPEQLLKQQQRTKDIFNLVLGAIAGISLLVGGIGIMNIMFASVLERIKEIGTRLAIGAKKADIIAQFLSESILIAVGGGLIGVLLGIGLSLLITHFAKIETIITFSSVIIAFGVSAAVGVIFGYAPARRAADRNPIDSLRHE